MTIISRFLSSQVTLLQIKNPYWVDCRVRINLQSVDVISGVLEQAVVGVQHLMGQKVQPFPNKHTDRITVRYVI